MFFRRVKRFFLFILGYCKCGRFFVYPKRRRLNTAYVDEELNYMTSCLDCYREIVEYYKERWADYYHGLL